MKKLTISIVNYNGGEHLIKCLNSLEKVSKELDFDIFVVDNASTDDSLIHAKKEFPQFDYIENKKNLGFGKAHNIILKRAKTPYVLVLNPDCEVLDGTLKTVFDYMEKNPEVGAATCKVEKPDGSLDIASHRGFPTPYASFQYFFLKNDRLYHLTDKPMNEIHEVDSIVGAFMFLRKSVLEKVGYFDEDYFMYGEDIDLCFRIKEKGFKVIYIPQVKIIHVKGVSSGIKKDSQDSSFASNETKQRSKENFYSTMGTFYKKHYEKKYPFFINWMVYLGINYKKRSVGKTV